MQCRFWAAGLIVLFSGGTLAFPDAATGWLTAARAWTLNSADWLFAITPGLVLIFVLYLAISPLGRIRLGGAEARPDFTRASWVAVLFAPASASASCPAAGAPSPQGAISMA